MLAKSNMSSRQITLWSEVGSNPASLQPLRDNSFSSLFKCFPIKKALMTTLTRPYTPYRHSYIHSFSILSSCLIFHHGYSIITIWYYSIYYFVHLCMFLHYWTVISIRAESLSVLWIYASSIHETMPGTYRRLNINCLNIQSSCLLCFSAGFMPFSDF